MHLSIFSFFFLFSMARWVHISDRKLRMSHNWQHHRRKKNMQRDSFDTCSMDSFKNASNMLDAECVLLVRPLSNHHKCLNLKTEKVLCNEATTQLKKIKKLFAALLLQLWFWQTNYCPLNATVRVEKSFLFNFNTSKLFKCAWNKMRTNSK